MLRLAVWSLDAFGLWPPARHATSGVGGLRGVALEHPGFGDCGPCCRAGHDYFSSWTRFWG
eukprot:4384093-Alexandrium_andersonii.AAC.1